MLSANPLARIELFLKATPGNFRDAMEVAEKDIGRKISCLVSDVFLWFTADMAEEMGVPWVAIRTAALYSLSVHIYTDAIREAVGVAGMRRLLCALFQVFSYVKLQNYHHPCLSPLIFTYHQSYQ